MMGQLRDSIRSAEDERDLLVDAVRNCTDLAGLRDACSKYVEWCDCQAAGGVFQGAAAGTEYLSAKFLAEHLMPILKAMEATQGQTTNRRLADDLDIPMDCVSLVTYQLRQLGCVNAVKAGRSLALRLVTMNLTGANTVI